MSFCSPILCTVSLSVIIIMVNNYFPPSPPYLSSLRFGYDYSMEHRLYNQAIFYAERIIDEVKGKKDATPDIILHMNHLLAQALYHDHQIGRAYYTLQNALSSPATWTHPSRHLLAQCCELLSRYEEGIRALVISYDNNTYIPDVIANGPAGAFLLAQLYEKNGQYDLALPTYEKSLEAGPFMFAAYERIAYLRRRALGDGLETPDDSEWNPSNCFSMERLTAWHTLSDNSNVSPEAASASAAATVIPVIESSSNSKIGIDGVEELSLRKPLIEANVTLIKSTRGVKDGEIPRKNEMLTKSKSSELLCNILKNFGHVFEASTRLDLHKAQRIINDNMTSTQANSRYLLLKLAEVAFDRGEYEEAEDLFCNMFTAYPFITEGVGKYSTLLWHQRKKRALVELSRRVLTYGRLRSESWICAANLDSLDLDHVEARMKLEKARLLNHRDANICCLIGHELSSVEQFDQAAYSYSQALKLDPTCYAAWFGISQICRKQDRLDDCEYHIRKAIEMNPYHPVLKVALGSLLSSRGRADEALSVLDSVCDENNNTATNGSHVNALYERSRILAHIGRIDDAIKDVRKVVEALPNEAAGHALLGQLLSRSGDNNAEALTHLNLALEQAGCGMQGSTIRGGSDDGMRGIIELINNLSSIGGIRKTTLSETSSLQENRPPTFPIHQRLRFNSLSSTGAIELPNRLSLSQRNRSESGSDDQQAQRMSLGSSMLDSVLEEEPDPLVLQGSAGRRQQQQQSPGRVFRPPTADPFAPTFYRIPTAEQQHLPTDQHGTLPDRSNQRLSNNTVPAAVHIPVTVQQSPLAIPRPSRPPPPPSSSVEDTTVGDDQDDNA